MQEEQSTSTQSSNCRYCGCPLNPSYYFCPNCATPHMHVERVLPPSQPTMLGEGTLIARKAPQVWNIFWTYLIVVASMAIVSAFFLRDEVSSLILGSAAMLVTTCILGGIHFGSLKAQFAKIGFNRPEAYVGLVALFPVLLIGYGLQKLMSGGHDGSSDLQENVPNALLIITVCVFPAVLEETAFRGLVQHWLQAALRPWRAMLLASALFTALHFRPQIAPYHFLAGMLLGWTKYKTGSLYPSMLIHFLHNLLVLEVFH